MVYVNLNDEQIMAICSQLRGEGKADKRFDINLPEGRLAENFATELFTGGLRCEVKRDFKVSGTGNIAIEYSCNDRPSGLACTKAEWWLIILDGEKYNGKRGFLVEVEQLKNLAAKHYRLGHITTGGDNNQSKMVLIAIKELWD